MQSLVKQQSANSNQDIEDYAEYCYDEEIIFSNQGSCDQKQILGIKILPQDDIFDSLQQSILDLQEVISLNFDAMLEIFHQFGWNKDKLKEVFFESEQQQTILLKSLKQSGILVDSQAITQEFNQLEQCPICCEQINQQNPIYYLKCGHQFCMDCWINFISEKSIASRIAFMTCMESGCSLKLSFSFIKQVTNKSPKIFEGYVKSLCRGYIDGNKNLAWCPGVDCKYCVQVTDVSSKEVHCLCGQIFCFRCRDEIHVPAPCDMVQKWTNEVKKDEANMKWILVNTKMCPFCKKPVERSDGCEMMTCRPPGGCGEAFCYVCSQPWAPTHVDHFKCSLYKPDKEFDQLKTKEQEFLKIYNFYYGQWLLSEQAKRKFQERKLTIPKVIQIIYENIQVSYHESQFLETAIKELIESRTALKWFQKNKQLLRSQCFAFYISKTHSKSVELFSNLLEQFGLACEKLAGKMNDLFYFVDQIKINTQHNNSYDLFQEFKRLKVDIKLLMQTCNKYKNNLVDSVNSGEVFIESDT